jgi:hypothetical protein
MEATMAVVVLMVGIDRIRIMYCDVTELNMHLLQEH